MSTIPDDLITTKEAADLLKKSPRTLETWRRYPQKMQPVGYYHDGYRIWYSRSEVESIRNNNLTRIGPEAVA